jgi:hypothetical protein
MTSDEADALGIPEEQRRFYVRMDSAKVNIAAPMAKAKWFHLVSVPLGNRTELYPNGDEVQTVETWSPAGVFEGLDLSLLNRILDTIDAGLAEGERYSDDGGATTRAAWKAAQQHAFGKTEAQCREIIRQWVKTGVLVRERYYSQAGRKERSGLKVSNTKRPGTVTEQ